MTEPHSQSDRRRRRGRLRRRLLRVAAIGASLAAVLALAALLLRDLPRRLLERELSARLEARVTIERLRLRPDIELRGVRIRSMRTLPGLAEATAPRVVVHGRWRSLLGGAIDRLEVPTATARLLPVCGRPFELPEPRGRVALVELGSLELEVEDGERRARAVVSGVLERTADGGGLVGELALRSESLELAPVVALWRPELAVRCGALELPVVVRVEEVGGVVTIAREGAAAGDGPAPFAAEACLTAARALASRAGAQVGIPSLRLEASLRPRGEGSAALAATLRADGLERAAVALITGSSRPGGGAAGPWSLEVEGLELGPLLPLAAALGLPGEVEGAGRLDARIEAGGVPTTGAPGVSESWPLRVAIHLDRLALRDLEGAVTSAELEGLAGELTAALEPAPGASRPFRAAVRLDRLRLLGLDAFAGALSAVEVGTLDGDLGGALRRSTGAPEGAGLLDRWTAADLDLRARAGTLRTRGKGGEGGEGADRLVAERGRVAPLSVWWKGEASREALGGAGGLASSGLGEWTVDGRVLLPREESGGALALDWSWAGDRVAVLLERWLELDGAWPESATVGGAIRARGSLRGPLAAPRGVARLSWLDPSLVVDLGALSPSRATEATPIAVHAAALELDVEGSAASGLSVRTRAPVRAAIAVDQRAPEEVVVSAAGGWREPGSFELERLALDGGELGRLELGGTASQRASEAWRIAGALALRDASLQSWGRRLAVDGSAWADLLAPLDGTLDLDLELSRSGDEDWLAAGTLALAGGGWASVDGARVVQGFEPRLAVSARPAAGGVEVGLEGPVGGFQALWDTFFFDYGSRFAELEATLLLRPEVASQPADESALGAPLEASIRARGEGVEARGRLGWRSAEALEAAATIEVADLDGAWRTWVREPLAGSGALAEDIALAGRARLELGATREGERWSVRGDLGATDAAVAVGEDSELRGLGLALPIDLTVSRASDGAVEIRGEERTGALRFTRLRAGGLEVAPVDAALSVRGDRVSLRDRLSVPLFGGVVELDALALEGALGGRPALEAGVQVAGLDLRQATEAFGLFPLEGRVDAGFPRVTLSEGRLETDVEGSVSIFGGRAEVTELSGSDLFSSFPRLYLSTRLRDIDLRELTRTLEFGEITGFVHGEIEDLELIGATPVRFQGWVRSVPDRRSGRRVSIRAVNNLARLGTGSDLGVLQRGFRRLFDSYPYASLGLALALRQDDFLLRGMERRGEKELFLKGRWPLRLDIVNVKPGTRVSFSTMMRRIGNLEIRRGAPATSPR
ncbi:MAG TPA: hypothetical protein VMV46_08195 [Thermoanaerobaculia bacterium]|nr:hypothetical protein [Thermoanaerobaculia bacterium]